MLFRSQFVLQGKYGKLDSELVSYGPCQTPTLGFCVKRHDFIQEFVPEPFWYLKVSAWAIKSKQFSETNIPQVSVRLGDGSEIALEWGRTRLFDKQAVEHFLDCINESKTAWQVQ